MNPIRYKTAPIESWARAKELRRENVRHFWSAKDKGELVIKGLGDVGLYALLAGFGNYGHASLGPYYSRLMADWEQLVRCLEAAESRGFDRDICASMRCHLGQLYTGTATWDFVGKKRVDPDIVVDMNWCRSPIKTSQLYAEHLGIPIVVVDLPVKDSPHTRQYLVAQMEEAIAAIEKLTGRRFDNEKFLDALNNEMRGSVLWARICELNKNIPAPLDDSQMRMLSIPIITSRHKKEAVQYAEMLYDEVKHRVEMGISARGWEIKRLTHEGPPVFFHLGLFKIPNEYEAVCIGGGVDFNYGAWVREPDGAIRSAQTPQDRGVEIRTGQDGLRVSAEWYLTAMGYHAYCLVEPKPKEFVMRAKDWHADGVLLHMDRGCAAYQAGMLEVKALLQETGIPTGTYEASQADPRDMSLPQVKDSLESFLESLGLTRLEVRDGHVPG